MQNKINQKAIIIGAGIAGPLLAIQLKRIGYQVSIFESRANDNSNEGVFMGLTPNGLNILKQFISIDKLKTDYTLGSMFFFNSKGQEIASLPTDYQKEKYGAETLQIKRWNLYQQLNNALLNENMEVHYNKKVVTVSETNENVKVVFEDGTTTEGDLLFACDGTFSAVRKTIFPSAIKPQYTKNISTGGFAKLPELQTASKGINMAFGERGFFAYAVSNKGEIWWFNNYHRENEPTKEEVKTVLNAEITSYLLDLHKNDDPVFSKIIKASHHIVAYPVYDIPKVDKWHTSKICLVGDAAHATSPHIGQGASLAMEDTVCISNCLKENKNAELAFQTFQQMRQHRVEKMVKQARKHGDNKAKPNPIAVWFRDRMLKYFIKAEVKKVDWIYGYKIFSRANN